MTTLQPKVSHPRTKEFFELMRLHSEHWDEWTKSSACIFNTRAVIILKNFYLTGKHELSMKELGITFSAASNVFMNAKRALDANYPLFLKWVEINELEKRNIIRYYSDSDKFLNSPLIFLGLNVYIKNALVSSEYETIGEILANYSEIKIKELRGMGAKRLLEFKTLLNVNDCLHLLRSE